MGKEAFKIQVTAERGRDKLDVKEGTSINDIIDFRSDKNFVQNAANRLRATVSKLNDKLKKAQGLLGTSLKGLSDKEIGVAVRLVQEKLNKLHNDFKTKLKAIFAAGDTKEELDVSHDLSKSELIDKYTEKLNAYIDGELDKVLKTVDDMDADKEKIAQALNPQPKVKSEKKTLANKANNALSGKTTQDKLYKNLR